MSEDLHPDHLSLLALAKAAIRARDDRALWKRSALEGAELHGAACDALWRELESQGCTHAGGIPVLEHPSVRHKRMVRQMRSEIIAVVQASLEDALNSLADGPRLIDDDELMALEGDDD